MTDKLPTLRDCGTCGAVIADSEEEAAEWAGQPWPWHRGDEDCSGRALRIPPGFVMPDCGAEEAREDN